MVQTDFIEDESNFFSRVNIEVKVLFETLEPNDISWVTENDKDCIGEA